ncbi:MAG: cytochrome c oxidase assembly protein [Myxococcota bacterium]
MDPAISELLRSGSIPLLPGLAVGLVAWLYLRGFRVLHARSPERFPAWRRGVFLSGLALFLVAIASPLDALSSLLLEAHMLQHLLLGMWVPPLLWLGAPLAPLLRGLPARFRKQDLGPFLAWPLLQRALHALLNPAVAWLLFFATTWLWHWPRLYELALRSQAWHDFEHLCFLAAGLLFWFPVVQPWPARARWPRAAMLPYLLLAGVCQSGFAALFAFSNRVFYSHYLAGPDLWGISPQADQAAAAALLWVGGSLVLLVAVFVLVVDMLEARGLPRLARPPRRPNFPGPASVWLRAFGLRCLASRSLRRLLQGVAALLALAVVADGLWGPREPAASNLAGVLPWTHVRGLALLGVLLVGNLFCALCPFTLSRGLAQRLRWRRLAWPRALRGKWPAFALLLLFFWSYEFLRVWDSPLFTAWIVLAYFAGSFLCDALFSGGRFCKHVCPVGQFGFAFSTLSPLEVRARDVETCDTCMSHDCLRGNAEQPGCATDLFLPRKHGNLDCTFCMDCVRACPHGNAGLAPAVPARDLQTDVHRSGIGRFSQRTDVAALAALLVFAAFVNAAWMLAPVMQWRMGGLQDLARFDPLWLESALWVGSLVGVPLGLGLGLGCLSARVGGVPAQWAAISRRMLMTLLPLGFFMWLGHLGFHLATGAGTLVPAAARAARDAGLGLAAAPDWALAMPQAVPGDLLSLQLVGLGVGLLLTLHASWRVASSYPVARRRALGLLAPWALLAVGLYGLGVWILDQPMQMRGTWGA